MTFPSSLNRIRRWRRFGRWLVALLAAAALACLLALGAGLADAGLAFEASGRSALVATVLVVLSLAALAALGKASLFSRKRGAETADRLLASPRNPASAALTLDPAAAETPLARHLAERSHREAAAELAAIPVSNIIPWRPIGLAASALALAALPIGILWFATPDATRTVAQRLMEPEADLPPWSPLRFAIDPVAPSTVYGGELEVAVEITGGELEHPVELLVRRPGTDEVLRLPSFRESDTRFSRTLDALTEPVSIAFACGKARSTWVPVELLLQPKVLAGKVTITPPAYTGREAATTPLDTNEIAAIEGSEIVLEVTSNRPLAPSALVFTPATAPGVESVPEEIPGEIISSEAIAFRWIATRPGKLSAMLRDVRGTPATTPLDLGLKALPDQAPVVDLASPPRFLLATPSSTLRLAGRAEDDHALSKVQLVRTLEGFRDRTRVVAPTLRDKAFDFADAVQLSELGVHPGQTIELFLQASDHNPSLLGQGASEISRVQIISEDDYAYRIRAKTTLEQFGARYAAIAQAFEQAKQSLDAMDKAADLNDPAAVEKARQDATAAHQQAAELLEALANDFPAFELEQRLKDLAAKGAADAKQNLEQLGAFDPKGGEADQRRAIREMRDRLGARQQEHQQLQDDAKTVAEAGKLLEMAAKFQQIYQTQVSISKRIRTIAEEINKGNDQNRRLLPSLAETQDKNREALDQFASELKKRAEACTDPALAPLAESSLQFLEALRLSDPQSVMESGAKAGRLGVANDAFVQAELARGLLETLMQRQDDPFAQACQGQCMNFSIPRPDVNATMQQLLEGLMCQNPGMSPNQGQGGGGMGGGGTGPTGNAAPGFSMMDLPVVGPQRMNFEPASMGGSADGKGQTTPGRQAATAAESSSMKPSELPRETRSAPEPESVPEPYREAVKRYFDPES
ncbi:DUF4175 domain-containing protein [Luteolibacter flavescens]|uniref:DUF4175 domain-containing protein n=1 Tax=Luteolibacter flavescens TaxID=1859460 RepID=A0ABT3FQ54_9BACT|nr:DUF4175 domain-containing protein [Luteolibacter flavescens]MCW1885692.1 DUF4175 domain-containing protein [Luteolibacter flavescens]